MDWKPREVLRPEIGGVGAFMNQRLGVHGPSLAGPWKPPPGRPWEALGGSEGLEAPGGPGPWDRGCGGI